MTAALLELGDWMADLGVTRVVMEATSDYWRAPFYLLEDRFETWLVNAHDVKHLPGRPKTDRLDAVWLCKVAERQTLQPSFVPPPQIRQLPNPTQLASTPGHGRQTNDLLRDAVRRRSLAHGRFQPAGRESIMTAHLDHVKPTSGDRCMPPMSAGPPAGLYGMTTVISHMSMSLDGYVAGPDQSEEQPLGLGGLALHQWHFDPVHPADLPWQDQLLERGDAYLMGRNMFGPGRGPWQGDWRGWWGDEPPYHAPVFVLTHYAREPVEMAGGTTFFFVTDGFESALKQASNAAGDGVVDVAGGASTVRQALASGALDELIVDIAPVVLGRGESMFGDLTELGLTQVEVAHSPHVTHIRYRVTSASSGRP